MQPAWKSNVQEQTLMQSRFDKHFGYLPETEIAPETGWSED